MTRLVDKLEEPATRMWDRSPFAGTDSQPDSAILTASAFSIAISLKRIADTLDSVLTNGTSDDLYGTAIRTSDTPGRG